MSRRKVPGGEDVKRFIGDTYGRWGRLPSAQEVQDRFGGSLESSAALLRLNSDLSGAIPSGFNARKPDWCDEVASVARSRHNAELQRETLSLRTALAVAEADRDAAQGALARLRAGCQHNCRPAIFESDSDDRAARAIDGSVTLSDEDMDAFERVCSSLQSSTAPLSHDDEDDDDIPF